MLIVVDVVDHHPPFLSLLHSEIWKTPRHLMLVLDLTRLTLGSSSPVVLSRRAMSCLSKECVALEKFIIGTVEEGRRDSIRTE